MKMTEIKVNKDFIIGEINPRIFGSFVEHMGRVVYSGIYEKDHKSADENGFRKDVMEVVKRMGVTVVRYPGGNFVSNYNWMDGIGPVEKRPKKRDLAWKSIETNEVGTDEFMKWAEKAGIEPIFAVNLGTCGINEALALLEYCNLETGTYYSDLRCENGRKDPYKIKTWCLGNEMDGDWQLGHKTATEYGRTAHEVGKAMKLLDPSIELIVCGSSMSTNGTFGEWEETVLSHTYDCADYVSLHQYYGGQEKGTAAFLAQSLDMERYIKTVCNICDVEQVRRKSKKQMRISFDEWGVWAIPDHEVTKKVEENPWQTAPAISEQIYTMEDALLFASMMMTFLKYSDRVKIGCQSLLTNISACIMTERQGDVWVQPIYYPFYYIANYAKGIVLQSVSKGETYKTDEFETVPVVDHVTVYNQKENMLILFLVNRSEDTQAIEHRPQGFELAKIKESFVLFSEDIKSTNLEDHHCVEPVTLNNSYIVNQTIHSEMLPYSFQMITIELN